MAFDLNRFESTKDSSCVPLALNYSKIPIFREEKSTAENLTLPIKPPDYEAVPLPQNVEGFVELGAVKGFAGDLVRVDFFVPLFSEGISLEIEILIVRRDAGVSDEHGYSVTWSR